MARGAITDDIQKKAMETIGREITQVELRLMAYVQYTWMNSQSVGREKINRDENKILNQWEAEGFVELDSDIKGRRVYPTKRFYDAVSEILWLGYCWQ
jgi:hypothetical protein